MSVLQANLQFNFEGQHVVVTGGVQGIGLQIVQKFLAAGAEVTVWDYAEAGIQQAQELLKEQKIVFTQVNVADRESCMAAAEHLRRPVDILVNNAGITRDKSFSKMTGEDFDAVIATNLNGLFNVTKALQSHFSEDSASKRIVNMSSVVALYGNFGQTNYVAAKAGVIGLTKTWAKELGRKGFTVNAIAPGFTRTSMVAAVPDEVLKSIENKVPVQRLGETEDIANACLFLASREAGYINGTVLSVDGGLVL